MIRNVLAGIAGIALAIGVNYVMELIGHVVYPPPAGLDFGDPDAMGACLASVPAGALLIPIAAYGVGTFCGIPAASLAGTARPASFAGAVAIVVLALAIGALIWIPHPAWFSIFVIVGVGASAWLAADIAGRVLPRREPRV